MATQTQHAADLLFVNGQILTMDQQASVQQAVAIREIDYCPQCRGVWLDRGELDKLIERPLNEPPFSASGGYRHTVERDDDDAYRPRRRKSFLSEFFDFD